MPELSNYRRELFCRYHLTTRGNQTKAALKAGFAPSSAKQYGSYLMTNHDVKARIQELKDAAFDASEITVELLLKAFWQEYTQATHPRDKIAALERLARMRGAFTDNVATSDTRATKDILAALRGHLPDDALEGLAQRFGVSLEPQEPTTPTHEGSGSLN